jgi:hypothetical protein
MRACSFLSMNLGRLKSKASEPPIQARHGRRASFLVLAYLKAVSDTVRLSPALLHVADPPTVSTKPCEHLRRPIIMSSVAKKTGKVAGINHYNF